MSYRNHEEQHNRKSRPHLFDWEVEDSPGRPVTTMSPQERANGYVRSVYNLEVECLSIRIGK